MIESYSRLRSLELPVVTTVQVGEDAVLVLEAAELGLRLLGRSGRLRCCRLISHRLPTSTRNYVRRLNI